jgi:ribose-phosphate pyrophosphokinase
MMIFSGTSNYPLAESIASEFGTLGKMSITKFSDGEIFVEVQENVRNQDVVIIQSLCSPHTNDHIIELLLIVDALKRASVKSITAFIPYFGYARQDRRPRSARVPISARVIANLLSNSGIERILTVELHADQIQGFFDVPVDNIYSTKQFATDINSMHLSNIKIVSPDVGGVLRARSLAKQVGAGDAELIIIDKRRPNPNENEIMNIIGNPEGCNCIIVDDIIDTAGTMSKAVKAMYDGGALSVRAYCSHAVLSGRALENLMECGITELIVTDTIPLNSKFNQCSFIRVLSTSGLLAETLRRINGGFSIKDLS